MSSADWMYQGLIHFSLGSVKERLIARRRGCFPYSFHCYPSATRARFCGPWFHTKFVILCRLIFNKFLIGPSQNKSTFRYFYGISISVSALEPAFNYYLRPFLRLSISYAPAAVVDCKV